MDLLARNKNGVAQAMKHLESSVGKVRGFDLSRLDRSEEELETLHLSTARKAFNLETELNKYRRPQVLIIDRLGYVRLDAQARNLFFQAAIGNTNESRGGKAG